MLLTLIAQEPSLLLYHKIRSSNQTENHIPKKGCLQVKFKKEEKRKEDKFSFIFLDYFQSISYLVRKPTAQSETPCWHFVRNASLYPITSTAT